MRPIVTMLEDYCEAGHIAKLRRQRVSRVPTAKPRAAVRSVPEAPARVSARRVALQASDSSAAVWTEQSLLAAAPLVPTCPVPTITYRRMKT
jgi:hypothetical protein